jgi:hypothetical protein
MVGLLNRLEGYRVKSNRENGDGRSDVAMYATSRALGKAVVFEFKPAEEFHELSAKCEEALKQIEDKKYADEWARDGYAQVMKYGIAFYRKDCLVMYATSRALGKAVIFEFKPAKEFHELSAKCEEALKQIEDKKYADEWARDGYAQVMKYGIAFYRKDCLVMAGE